ncbi:hypothetical protein Ccrd_021145 [Cynara cardunculus var. scolymus]|uniref:Uncharacterized protein n=1 Tax=Cynara cardunculus var. scolymus TaxID=59895 RepID=A0A124SEN0_CYNCS|nr:hypothetical protein Ccrd_021145 [Cynara cardunculus var. scolymus]
MEGRLKRSSERRLRRKENERNWQGSSKKKGFLKGSIQAWCRKFWRLERWSSVFGSKEKNKGKYRILPLLNYSTTQTSAFKLKLTIIVVYFLQHLPGSWEGVTHHEKSNEQSEIIEEDQIKNQIQVAEDSLIFEHAGCQDASQTIEALIGGLST